MDKNWIKAIISVAVFPAMYSLFCWNPVFSCGIAAIPVIEWVNTFVHISPIIARLCAFGLFALLLYISWYCAEIIVVLGSVAVAKEAYLYGSKLVKNHKEHYNKKRAKNKQNKTDTKPNFVNEGVVLP